MPKYFVTTVVEFTGYIDAETKDEAEERGYYYDDEVTYSQVLSCDAELDGEDEGDE